MITVYGIPNCDSVKRARAWLTQAQLAYEFHDFKKSGVPAAELTRWLKELGWERVLNRSGTTWRKLDEGSKAAVLDAASAAPLLMRESSCIKRPVVRWADGSLTLAFDEQVFSAAAKLGA